jgi:dynein heavy chain
MCKCDIPYDNDTFNLAQLLEAPLLQFQEDIEDISDQADKQAKLEKQLNELIAFWDGSATVQAAEFQIVSSKLAHSDKPTVFGGNITDIQEKFEESIMALNQWNAMRFVKPFK